MKSHGMLGFGMGLLFGGAIATFIDLAPLNPLPEVTLPNVSVAEAVRELRSGQKPVLVIDVREPWRASAVRAAIEDERVVAETIHGFALRERRLVVSSLEEAGTILASAGWEDAGLQILRFEPLRAKPQEPEAEKQDTQRLAELMQKPTLTYFEAQQALALL